jgi:hypothetical protein
MKALLIAPTSGRSGPASASELARRRATCESGCCRRCVYFLLWLPLIWSAVKVFFENFFFRYHLDFDPSKLVHLDQSGIPPTDVLLIGNGPLSAEQRAIIRNTVPGQVFRFNGMSNLHPGEPVGHLFARLSDNTTEPKAFWGIAPPPSALGTLEALFVPSAGTYRTRFMCSRVSEAVEIILLQGRPEDAYFYSNYYGIRVRDEPCENDCRKPELNGGYWSSGFLGLIHVLQKWPARRVHVFGMNWAKHAQADHPAMVEMVLTQRLVKSGDVVIHQPPSADYHQSNGGYVLGFRCGEWTPWWAPICYFSPHWYAGFIPVPPFFADPAGFQHLSRRQVAESKRRAELVANKVRPQLAVKTPRFDSKHTQLEQWEDTINTRAAQSSEERVLESGSLFRSKRGDRERISRLRVNLTQFDQDGYAVVKGVFSTTFIDELRKRILALQHEGTQFGPKALSAVDPGITIPDFMARSEFAFMHRLPSAPALQHVLKQVFRGTDYRFCSHNDIGINRIVGWHKDRLNDEYAHYQAQPLWGSQVDGGHRIVKALIYLQDHTDNDEAMSIVPGSYRTPTLRSAGARPIHPPKGSVVIFEQRSTHRGQSVLQGLLGKLSKEKRVLVSMGFGKNNIYTTQFEQGTRARQANQCGSKCASRLYFAALPQEQLLPPHSRQLPAKHASPSAQPNRPIKPKLPKAMRASRRGSFGVGAAPANHASKPTKPTGMGANKGR